MRSQLAEANLKGAYVFEPDSYPFSGFIRAFSCGRMVFVACRLRVDERVYALLVKP